LKVKNAPRVVTPAKAVLVPVNQTVATFTPNERTPYGTIVFLAMIGMAIVCFAAAAVPATHVPWRPAAYFVATRHLDLAIVGLALLLLAGLTFIATGGS
jgi:hypothetical protein